MWNVPIVVLGAVGNSKTDTGNRQDSITLGLTEQLKAEAKERA